MTPILCKPCSYDSASHKSAEVDDWSRSSGPGLFDFEDQESMDFATLGQRVQNERSEEKEGDTTREVQLVEGRICKMYKEEVVKKNAFLMHAPLKNLENGTSPLTAERKCQIWFAAGRGPRLGVV